MFIAHSAYSLWHCPLTEDAVGRWGTASGYMFEKTLKVQRLLRFLECASYGKSLLALGRTFEPMNLLAVTSLAANTLSRM